MKKKKAYLLLTAILSLALFSCGSKRLYSWHDYEKTSYINQIKSSDKSEAKLIESYEDIINTQKGSSQRVPPGIYADYGLLLLKQGKQNEGIAMMQKEVELYPESKRFIETMIKLIQER